MPKIKLASNLIYKGKAYGVGESVEVDAETLKRFPHLVHKKAKPEPESGGGAATSKTAKKRATKKKASSKKPQEPEKSEPPGNAGK